MEKLVQRRTMLLNALKTLDEVIIRIKEVDNKSDYKILRDSEIQRFEYSVDTFWKYLKEILEVKYGIISATPKTVIREYAIISGLSQSETNNLLMMVDDRNMTSHAYNESVAEEISKRIETFYLVMKKISQNI